MLQRIDYLIFQIQCWPRQIKSKHECHLRLSWGRSNIFINSSWQTNNLTFSCIQIKYLLASAVYIAVLLLGIGACTMHSHGIRCTFISPSLNNSGSWRNIWKHTLQKNILHQIKDQGQRSEVREQINEIVIFAVFLNPQMAIHNMGPSD